MLRHASVLATSRQGESSAATSIVEVEAIQLILYICRLSLQKADSYGQDARGDRPGGRAVWKECRCCAVRCCAVL